MKGKISGGKSGTGGLETGGTVGQDLERKM